MLARHFAAFVVVSDRNSSTAFSGDRIEPSFQVPHHLTSYVHLSSCNEWQEKVFRMILTFLGGYFKYLRALSWSKVLEVGAGLF